MEVFRHLFKIAQLANSHRSTSDKGQLRTLFVWISNAFRHCMVLRNFPHEPEDSEARIRPLAAIGIWGPRRGSRSITSAELYLAGFRASPDLLPGNGVVLDCFLVFLYCKLTSVLVVVRVLCPGPLPGRLGGPWSWT